MLHALLFCVAHVALAHVSHACVEYECITQNWCKKKIKKGRREGKFLMIGESQFGGLSLN
jgi:hypothetical protein